MKLLFATRT